MTLICATYINDQFDVYADTLVSSNARKFSSAYTKLLVLPVKYRTKDAEDVHTFELGMAVAGGVVVCTAVYGLLASLLQDLRSFDVERPPLFDEIVELAVSVARTIFEDSAPALEEASLFGFMLLGFEQETGEPRWTVVAPTEVNGKYEVGAHPANKLVNGASTAIGSAKNAFLGYLAKQEPGEQPSRYFYRFVMSGERPDIGGGMTYMCVDRSGARLIPLIISTREGDFRPEIAGLDADRLTHAGAFRTYTRARVIRAGNQPDDPVPEFIPDPAKYPLD